MNELTASLDLHTLIDQIERQASEMPRAYRESFRYIMHRDLHHRINMYARLAQRRIPPRSRIPHLWVECA